MTEAPEGWYDDPQVAGQQRYWDGSGWTDQVQPKILFDGILNLIKVFKGEQRRLVVTPNELWWGDEYVRWDEVVAFTQLTTIMSGIPYIHELVLQSQDRNVPMGFMARVKRDPIGDRAHAILIEQLRQTLGVRVLGGLMEMVENREPIRVGGLVLSPEGFAQESKDDPVVPWSEYAGLKFRDTDSIYIDLFRTKDGGKKKRAAGVQTDLLRSWVIPPIVEEHARRYGVNPAAAR
jgi:hypothetical protein